MGMRKLHFRDVVIRFANIVSLRDIRQRFELSPSLLARGGQKQRKAYAELTSRDRVSRREHRCDSDPSETSVSARRIQRNN